MMMKQREIESAIQTESAVARDAMVPEDRETGRVLAIVADNVALVKWDSGATSQCSFDDLCAA